MFKISIQNVNEQLKEICSNKHNQELIPILKENWKIVNFNNSTQLELIYELRKHKDRLVLTGIFLTASYPNCSQFMNVKVNLKNKITEIYPTDYKDKSNPKSYFSYMISGREALISHRYTIKNKNDSDIYKRISNELYPDGIIERIDVITTEINFRPLVSRYYLQYNQNNKYYKNVGNPLIYNYIRKYNPNYVILYFNVLNSDSINLDIKCSKVVFGFSPLFSSYKHFKDMLIF